MNHHLTAAVAQTRIADMHKAAASRRSVGNAAPTATSHDVAAHERQRELVCASLLLSRREDPPTHQRSA